MFGLTDTIQISRLSIPVWLLSIAAGALGAYVCSLIVFRHDRGRGRKVMDGIFTALLIYTAVWKLSPVVLRFGQVVRQPLAILYLPGGPIGSAAGLTALFIYLLVKYLRHRPMEKTVLRGIAFTAMAAVVVFLSTGLAFSASRNRRFIPSGASGQERNVTLAPDFEAVGIDGTTYGLSAYRGSYVVLNFWASWCPPCRVEIPELVAFHQDGGDGSTVVLAVNQTASEGNLQSIASFVEENGMGFPVLLDRRNAIHLLYGVRGIPTTFIIDPTGNIIHRRTGAVTRSWLRSVTNF